MILCGNIYRNLHSQTVRARMLKFWEKVHLPPPVTCHHVTKSPVRCHVSRVICHVSHVGCITQLLGNVFTEPASCLSLWVATSGSLFVCFVVSPCPARCQQKPFTQPKTTKSTWFYLHIMCVMLLIKIHKEKKKTFNTTYFTSKLYISNKSLRLPEWRSRLQYN